MEGGERERHERDRVVQRKGFVKARSWISPLSIVAQWRWESRKDGTSKGGTDEGGKGEGKGVGVDKGSGSDYVNLPSKN